MPAANVRAAVIGAVAFAAQTVALVVVLVVTAARTPLPVSATFTTDAVASTVAVASIDLGWALVALLAGGAVTFAAAAARTSRGSNAPTDRVAVTAVAARGAHHARHPPLGSRPRVVLLAGWSQGVAIMVFLVALVNGISEVSSLVPMYAIAATAVALQGIDPGASASTWRRPGSWAAAVGIVPWGVVAFAQIGTGAVVGDPGIGVRVVTLLALAVAVLGWVIAWRRASPRPSDVLVMTVGIGVVAWSAVALIVLARA